MADNNNQVRYEREPAKRVFAAELREAIETMKDESDEKSPTYVLLPTGERCNRIFVCGTVTSRDKNGSDQNVYYRARVSDPTGVFYLQAGQYQPEAMAQMANIDATNPCSVAVVGKPSVYEGNEGKKYLSLRVESVHVIDNETRAQWVLDTVKMTLDRIDAFENGDAPDVILARDKYSQTPEHWRNMVRDVLQKSV